MQYCNYVKMDGNRFFFSFLLQTLDSSEEIVQILLLLICVDLIQHISQYNKEQW